MFTIFALLKDATGGLTPEGLAALVKERFFDVGSYTVTLEKLHWPAFTNVVLRQADGWGMWFQIRQEDGRSIDPPTLGAFLRRTTTLPEGFDDYDTELVLHFDDDEEREHTDDIIFLTEFVNEQFPGVVLYNADAQDIF
ncbi:hypothetical protein G7070_00435 [Propioniciclava coleopterorum]|uniref:Uncharacterized protein n=1 Tax=Propioniciclava coleopterorum TaxID=2714937 RepID=A0A6G7Y2V9_9ACTN|nr:hypothetical protein [Propioniciclava coleopterorum]QIK71026.1 hypothetical protein G7070_00435 [Propioniciclava coleopterorum]